MFNLPKKENKKALKYGNQIFVFPDNRRVYQLKEDYIAKLPSNKLITIQENSNYIAHLGVSKTTLVAGHKMLRENTYEIKILNKTRGKAVELDKKCDEQIKLLDQIDITREQYDNTNEAILVSLFDMFFFFDNENIFEKSDETLELKRYYLNEYPYFRNFFFSEIERLYGYLQSHLSKLYPLCFSTNGNTGDSKGLEPYKYRRTQNELEMVLCRHYNFTKEYLNGLCIEDYYQHLNEYYSCKEKEHKT